jgi:anti-repressor protein
MNELKIFSNEQFGDVRVAELDGEPIFCLADICKVLDLIPSKVTQRISDGVLSKYPIIDSLSREQMANFVNEDGLYDVILDSRKPEAKKFRKWVTSEVLPSIRKHGAYMTEETIEKALTSPDFLIQLATKLKEEQAKNRILECANKDNIKLIEQQAPKALFADAVATSKRSCLIAELAKILQQNGINIGQNRLFTWMRENNYLGTKGEYYNQPTQRSMELGLFEIKKTTIMKKDGTVLVTSTTKTTGKGQIYFINKFLS